MPHAIHTCWSAETLAFMLNMAKKCQVDVASPWTHGPPTFCKYSHIMDRRSIEISSEHAENPSRTCAWCSEPPVIYWRCIFHHTCHTSSHRRDSRFSCWRQIPDSHGMCKTARPFWLNFSQGSGEKLRKPWFRWWSFLQLTHCAHIWKPCCMQTWTGAILTASTWAASKSSELEETGSKLRKIGKLKSMVLPQPGTSVNHIAWQRSQRPDLGALGSGRTSGETWDDFSSGSAKARCQVPNCFNRNHRHGAMAPLRSALNTNRRARTTDGSLHVKMAFS